MPTAKTKVQEPTTMAELVELLGDKLTPFQEGDVIEVTVISANRDTIMVDVAGLATGVIPEKEFSSEVSKLKPGEKINAYVINAENDNGYVILSLKRAEREKLWGMLEKRNSTNETIAVKVVQANKGGLVAEYGNMQGFIPVSQLSAKHYPRVDGDRAKIKQKLEELVGQNLEVKIINYDRASNKIVFSEKAIGDEVLEEKAKDFEVGQKVKGKITGIVDFGLFVDIGGIEALVHISQVAWQRINNLKDHYKIAQEIEAEIVNIDGARVSLSMKKLLPDPWNTEVKALKLGSKVRGEVTKITPYGAFVKLSPNLEGLFHVSQLEEGQDIKELIETGKNYDFEVTAIEPELRKISLKLA